MTPEAQYCPDATEMAAYDAQSIAAGVPGIDLMERAGRALTEKILSFSNVTLGKEVLILCGPGNNGGDGLVIARRLKKVGIPASVVVCGARKYSPEFVENLKRLAGYEKLYCFKPVSSAMEVSHLPVIKKDELKGLVEKSRLLIDCLLGNGQDGPPRAPIKDILAVVTDSGAMYTCFAVDVPTGVNASTGQVYAPVLKADRTFSIQFVKRGLLQYPAREACGELTVLDIGIEAAAPPRFSILSHCSVSRIKRSLNGHKGRAGSVLVIGGSAEMPGAPVLAAEAALKIGAGIVRIASTAFVEMPREIMRIPLQEKDLLSGSLVKSLRAASAVVLGPGLGISKEKSAFVLEVLQLVECPLVLDADGLTMLSLCERKPFKRLPSDFVLTPHPGEFSRLCGRDTEAIQADRYSSFIEYTEKHAATLVLKGAATLVGNSEQGWVQKEGNPYMATAGSGDVLAGVIAGLIAQGLAPLEAAKAGVFIHGVAGDEVARNVKAITASDIIGHLAVASKPLREEAL